jgi:hypothetical protein
MKRSRYVTYPFFIFALIFLLDKIALIPPIWEAGRGPQTPIDNLVESLRSHIEAYGQRKKSGESRPLVLFLGSSRSELFRHLTERSIRAAPSISERERKVLLSTYFEPRMAYKAADMFIQMLLIERLLEMRPRPDLTILEFSPEMLNANGPASIHRYIEESIFPLHQLYGFLPILQGEERREVLNRLLFASYAARFRPERLLGRLLDTDRSDGAQQFARAYLAGRPPVEEIPRSYIDYDSRAIPEEVYQERFLGYANYLKNDFVLKNYAIHPSELLSLYRILDLAAANELRIAIWIPPVHPVLTAYWNETEYPKRYPEIVAEIEKRGFPLIRGSSTGIGCSRFVDSSHLSARCATHLALDLLKGAGFID